MADYAGKQSRVQYNHALTRASEPSPGKRTLTEQSYGGTLQQRAKTTGPTVGASPSHGVAAIPTEPPQGDRIQRIFGHSNRHAEAASNVQRDGRGAATNDIHTAAACGLESPTTSLPFVDQIQASFGPHHDITSVHAHVGGVSTAAASAMNASAYATGNHTVFAGTPDLHTAAHEAAHVVQQREGVHLSGGVGQAGDAYERHADAVADRVVQKQSAADLLAPHAQASNRESESDRVGAISRNAEQVQLERRDHTADTYQPAQPGAPSGNYPQPAGAGVAAVGRCNLPAGTLMWALAPRVGYVNARIEFTPNATVAAAHPTISFIQTVSSSFFNPNGESEVDALPSETDPYYGAKRDDADQHWVDEPEMGQYRDPAIDDLTLPAEGSRPYMATTKSAVLNDSPFLNVDEVKFFETVVVIIETGERLGSLKWNIMRFKAGFAPAWLNDWIGRKQPTSTIVRNVVCTPGVSPFFDPALTKFYKDNPKAVRPSDGSAPHL